jgi:hypothetical protein
MDLTISGELDLSAWDTPQGDLIPFRNVLLAMLAALRADVIWCAGVKGDHTAGKSQAARRRRPSRRTAARPAAGHVESVTENKEADYSRGSVLPSVRRWSSITEATCRTHISNASSSSRHIPRSFSIKSRMCRTVSSGRPPTPMNLPVPTSAKPGTLPGSIP